MKYPILLVPVCLALFWLPHAKTADLPLAGDDAVVSPFKPSDFYERLAAEKSRHLERQWDIEKYRAASDMVTNWREYDITYYDIHWMPVYEAEIIYGEVGVYGKPTVPVLDSVILNLSSALMVDSVYDQADGLIFVHVEDHLTVYLPRAYVQGELFGFTVVYHGTPVSGPDDWGGLNFRDYNGTPSIDMFSEPYSSRQTWPCNDIVADKADSVDVRVRVDTGYAATSNGLLVSDTDHGDGTHTMHWRHRYPIATYLICLSISKYIGWNDYYHYSPTDSMLIMNFSYPDIFEVTYDLMSMAPEVLFVLSGLFGQYPFIDEKYGQTQIPRGGMEHQTNTFLTADTSQPEYQEYMLIHEMGHHWWGNMVTCRDWHNVWLNEGFTTYSDALYRQVTDGDAAFRAYMVDLEHFPRYSPYTVDTFPQDEVFDGAYLEGAWSLHMMRHMIGDSVFFEILRVYRETFLYKTAVTDDFKEVCESISGMDWDWYFDQWIYGAYSPYYHYSYAKRQADDGGWHLYLFIEQVQTDGAEVFVMPIDLRVRYDDGYEIVTVWNDGRKQNFIISAAEEPTHLEFDPDNWIQEKHLKVPYTIHIITDSLPSGTQGQPYEDSIVAVSIYGDVDYKIISGDLPSGWTLNPSTGLLSGLSYDTGQFTLTVKVTDAICPSLVDSSEYALRIEPGDYGPGDADADGGVNVADAVFIISYIFKNGPPPPLPNLADPNRDCTVNVGDAVSLINFIFKGGPQPEMGCVE